MSWTEKIALFTLSGVMAACGSVVGFQTPVYEAVVGCGIIVVLTLVGILISNLMPGKLPMVFWVSIVAILSATPISPIADAVVYFTGKIDFLALCTVVLAYAGLSFGKDLDMFKKMSWHIIVVALAVYTGTFLCATAIAQLMLHIEGLI